MALRRSALVAATVGGIVLLLLVVALSARGWPRPGVDPVRIDPAVMSEYLGPLLRWLYLTALALAFYHWLVGRDLRDRKAAPGRRRVSPVATLLALVLVATVALVLADLAVEGMTLFPSQPEGISPGAPAPRPAPSETVAANRRLGLALTAALLALAAVVGWRRGGRAEEEHPSAKVVSSPDPPPPPSPTDPRGRVFAAYRAVEARSGGAGWERGPAETVTRHLARLPVDHGDTRRLATLYNVARFSDHPVGSATADEAEEAAARIERALP